MRTVEQTADELVEKFHSIEDATGFIRITMLEAIQCAIIAIDYTIKCLEDDFSNAPHFDDEIEFQQQVKQELETRLNK